MLDGFVDLTDRSTAFHNDLNETTMKFSFFS